MLEILKQLIEITLPKQLGGALKRNSDLRNWLIDSTSNEDKTMSLSERAYLVINGLDSNKCKNNSIKKFISVNQGYRFCGMAAKCECARESVSNKVSAKKQAMSIEEKLAANAKRENTNIAKYGVSNAGQTELAKSKHRELYDNINKVKIISDGIKSTNLEKYGVENPMQVDFIKEKAINTIRERYGVDNPMQSELVKQRAFVTKNERYEPHHLAKLNYTQFLKNILENFELNALISKDEYIGVGVRPTIVFECIKCYHQFTKRFDYASPPVCKICNPTDILYKSKQELNLLDFIKTIYTGSIISGDKSIINPYELDIFLPDSKLAIEYCGLYWHSEISGKKSWNYHYRKWKSALDKDIQLITIFSDEWLNKRDIIESMLRNKLLKTPKYADARSCKIVNLSRLDTIDFYRLYHLLGAPVKLPINYGLIYKDEVVSCMSFIKTETSYELTRFASKNRIPGAASRLLMHFIKDYNPDQIVSFSDNRYSSGNLYKSLNFNNTGIVPPMQSYVKDYQIRYHKLELSKKKLLKIYPNIDMNKTEWAILQELNYDRIWDCGKIKWTWVNHKETGSNAPGLIHP